MKKILILFAVLACVVAAIWLVSALPNWKVNARMARLDTDIQNLFDGLHQYKEHVGAYPTGSNAQIVKALRGQNPKNIIILVSRKNELNPKGEFVDPWGTPFRIYFSDSSVLIRSAGPNGRFDDSSVAEPDDYYRSN